MHIMNLFCLLGQGLKITFVGKCFFTRYKYALKSVIQKVCCFVKDEVSLCKSRQNEAHGIVQM